MIKSLAYRNNEEDIINGIIPNKYNRILPFIKGKNILEVGAAEGVLSLLLAKQGKNVIAIEKNKERYQEALRLKDIWNKKDHNVNNCHFVNCDISSRLDLLENIDTIVAVRTIYYFRERLNSIFFNISKRCRFVVLSGNTSRALNYKQGNFESDVGEYNYYASSEGMVELLEKYGYVVTTVIPEEHKIDPIVVGEKNRQDVLHEPDYRVRESLAHHLIKKGIIQNQNQIRVSIISDTTMDVDTVLEKSRGVLERCHVTLLKEYEKQGDNFNYKTSEYWSWLCKNRQEGITKRGDPPNFFRLYNKIKTEGFKTDVRNPVIVCDIKRFGLKWQWHRANGSHRVSVAKALGLKIIPVLLVSIDIISSNN